MEQLQVFTFENLTLYDELIKDYINTADDVVDAKSLKTVAIEGNVLKFYKVEEPVGETSPTYEITLPQTDLTDVLARLLALENDKANKTDIYTKLETDNAINGLQNTLQGNIDNLAEYVGVIPNDTEGNPLADDVIGYINKRTEGIATDTALEELTNRVTSVENNKADKTQVTTDIAEAVKAEEDARKEAVQGVQDEVDVLEQTHTTDKAALEEAIELKVDKTAFEIEVARAQKAEKDNADAILDLENKVTDNAEEAKVTLTTAGTATEGYLKTYVISQGTTEVGKIDIPKELVVTAGEVVVNPEGQSEGTYIKLTIANQEAPIYINVKDLVDVYTTQAHATEIQLAISDTNEISATIVNGSISRNKLDADLEADIKALEDAIGVGGNVETQISDAISELDANVISATVEEGKGIQVQIIETDGKVTSIAVTGSFDNAYDVKGTAEQALSDAKEYADSKDEAIAEAKQAGVDAANAVTALENGAVADNAQAIADIQAAMPIAITNEQINSLFTKTV